MMFAVRCPRRSGRIGTSIDVETVLPGRGSAGMERLLVRFDEEALRPDGMTRS